MTQSVMNVTPEDEGIVDAISHHDAKSWELVSKVTKYMHNNAMYNYTEAFRQLGVSKTSFYAALRVPFVQNQLLQRYREQNVAELELINTSWFPIVRYQMELARGDHGARDAASAARWVKDRLEVLEARIETPEEVEEGAEATILLEAFMRDSDKIVKMTRTKTVDSIEI